jgi:uncharacterized protein (DUF2252 family)
MSRQRLSVPGDAMSIKIVSPAGRQKALEHLRLLKMASSAHAFMRGSTDQFYDWVESAKISKSLPSGPPVWICGDCHTGNLGPVADLKGNIDIQIRDLDQTVIGNPAYDLIRLAVSLAMAARSADLPGVTTALMLEAMIEAYTTALTGNPPKSEVKEVEPLNRVMQSSLKRKWRHLAEERIEDVRPSIPLGNKFWPLTKREHSGLENLLDDPKQRDFLQLVTRNEDNDKVTLVDAAYWVKGCSSLGRVRYAALVQVAKRYRLIELRPAWMVMRWFYGNCGHRMLNSSFPRSLKGKQFSQRIFSPACWAKRTDDRCKATSSQGG